MSERDGCPTFMGYQFHRYPCANSGRIDDLLTTTHAEDTEATTKESDRG